MIRVFSPDPDVVDDVKLEITLQCRVEFDISDEDIEKGSYGFDSYNRSIKGLEIGDLKSEYHRYEDVFNKEYFAPWVSIRKNQLITLDVKIRMGRGNRDIKIKLDHPKFTFSPNEITKETGSIDITCNEVLEVDTLLELKTDSGRIVGAIKFWKNKVKTVGLEIIYLGINPGDINLIKEQYRDNTIETYLKKAFTPALIDFNVSYRDLDLCELLNKPPINLYLANITSSYTGLNVEDKKEFIFNVEMHYNWCIKSEWGTLATENGINEVKLREGRLTLYLTAMQCCTVGRNNIVNYINGLSYRNFIMMFLGNERSNPTKEIPHEIMHSLGLEHIFNDGHNQNQKMLYNQFETYNYMDYCSSANAEDPSQLNRKQTTYKWQWKVMSSSNYSV